MPSIFDLYRSVFGGGDPADSGLAYASSQASPDLLQYAQDVLSGKVAAGGALAQNNYDPNRSFAQNALDPRAIEQATDVAFGIGPGAIRAYHGSPHSFDRFDISKIGTGEGAQAYGHGLYFAENEGVARGYRDTLAGKAPLREYGSQPLETNRDWYNLIDKVEPQDWRLARIIDAAGKQGGVRSALDTFEPHTRNASDGPLWSAAIERFKEGVGPAAKGHMYEVSLHADPKAFLDWDRPLAEQPAGVREILSGLGINSPQSMYRVVPDEAGFYRVQYPSGGGMALSDRLFKTQAEAEQAMMSTAAMKGDNPTGGAVYESSKLAPGDFRDPAMASAALREAGIPGIRYLDQGSRVSPSDLQMWQEATKHWEDVLKQFPNEKIARENYAQASGELARLEKQMREGTSNYAIFDPGIIEILRKYGILPPAAATGGLLATQGEPPT